MNAAEPSNPRKSFHYCPRPYESWVLHAYQDKDDRTVAPRSWLLASQFHFINFQFFVSVNPTHRVTIPYLQDIVKRFIEDSVHQWKTIHRTEITIGYVAGYETTASGGSCDPHIHMAIVSNPSLDLDFIKRRWRKIVGPNPKSLDVQRVGPTFADSGNVLKYCLKGADDPKETSWDWDFSANFKSFRPSKPDRHRPRNMREMFRKLAIANQLANLKKNP